MCTLSCGFLFMISLVLFFCGMVSIMFDLVLFVEWEVVSLNSMSIVMTLLLDWMSLLFMSFVSMISSLVIFYSKEYMSDEENIDRFVILVIMFVISMAFLIISPNLISILLGWDGLGLVSYLLVIYFQNVKSYGAGMLTALSNKIGDVALLLSVAWMLNYGGWNYIFYLDEMVNSSDMLIIGGLVMIAGLTKSAQIPFSSWLPAAMAAPTPVSALVHSSTLVTAGVYLLIRFNVLICGSWLGNVLLLLSGLTMFMAGLGANYEFDLKKIIALSTLSQLGLMMSILAMGFYKLAFFHLLTHALFKALLFMCAGAIIHNMNNNQDIRSMGGLGLMMPMTSSCFNVANLTLCGMPFLAGFYSKDLILEMVSLSYVNGFAFLLFFVSTGLTACYSFRLVYYTMTGSCKNLSLSMVSDEGWVMLSSMLGLLALSIVGGSMLSWLIFPSPLVICLPLHLKLLTLFVCIVGGVMGYVMSNVSLYFFNKSLYYYSSTNFLGSMWFMPYISTYGIISGPLIMGESIFKSFDHGWSEYFGGQQLFSKLIENTQVNQMLQDNSLKIYLLSFVFWMIILVGLSIYF
uniref:NADH-ubiquinone oxidoreductase chain 5 n=2 Tax=Gasterophilus TaxID=84524 RepID=A0A4P7YDS5_9MUSC|nr:NADH dehydrogenase subunit 5 [Gasterophilus haemorrhoidalis]YP_009653376.1 NADH dehydrogenase subunit 5 [Gasterophilus inermis]QCG71495.1 NADH dehydrogenase subunit 5 [Gasterophilus haemorrhoidalis]QCG71509.1 NADH dehydrogenase subunit 5 [Gasterophilus inermis]